jgi:hypothetical protein
MKTYTITLDIRAECEDDARELLEDYTGQETSVDIKSVKRNLEEDY